MYEQNELDGIMSKMNSDLPPVDEKKIQDEGDLPQEEPAIIPEVIPLDKEKTIAKFDVARSAIAILKKKYKNISVKDHTDKDGISKLKAALSEMKGYKVKIEKKRAELKAPFLEMGKALDQEAKELTALVMDVLDPLSVENDRVTKLIDAEKNRKEKEAAELLAQRLEILRGEGICHDGMFWVCGDVAVSGEAIKVMNDEKFGELKSRVMSERERLDKIRAEAAAEREKEEARIAKEKQDLADQQEELNKQKRELEESRMSTRKMMITAMGWAFSKDGSEFSKSEYIIVGDAKSPVSVSHLSSKVSELDDTEFFSFFQKITQDYNDTIIKAKDHLEVTERFKSRVAHMESIGLIYSYKTDAFIFPGVRHNGIQKAIVMGDDEAYRFSLDMAITEKKDHDDKEADEKEKKEKERLASIPEIDRILEYLSNIQTAVVDLPEVKDFSVDITAFKTEILSKVDSKIGYYDSIKMDGI